MFFFFEGGGQRREEVREQSEHQRYKRIPEVPLVLALLEPPPECCSRENDYLWMHTIRERGKRMEGDTEGLCALG